ncbi:hypothetical protein JTB14_014813 [Gonioctena quinquepunctata]|nr:hypothetical protein JTB14_014813 [Gonioctena quinquepunctata]
MTKLPGGDDHIWTSGTRLIDGKNFIWLGTAKPIEYTNWQQGEPSNINEKCLEFLLVRNKDLYWNDRDCTAQLYFVCEKEDKKQQKENEKNWPAIFENPNVSPNVNLLNYKGKSYYFNNYFTATFLEANCFCQAIDMELVTIESDDENTRLYNYIRDTLVGDSFWSSGTRLVDDKTWIWLPTGKRVGYTHWQSGQPDNKNEKCIQLIQQRNTGLDWNDLSCTSALNFICQSPTKKYTRCPSAGDGNCPSTSSPVIHVTASPLPPKQQEKYKINADKLTYTQAVQACKDQSMQLVSIQTKEKNDAINKLIQQRGTAEAYWTSGNRIADEKTWVWLNNDKLEYFNWNQGEPNNAKKNEFGIEIFKVGGDSKWNDAPLDFKSAYICESIITSGCGTQCCSPVVNVYVNNNVISSDGTDSKNIYSSLVSKPGQSYDVEVKNNINENGLESVDTKKIYSQEYHVTNKRHPGKYSGKHPGKHPEKH